MDPAAMVFIRASVSCQFSVHGACWHFDKEEKLEDLLEDHTSFTDKLQLLRERKLVIYVNLGRHLVAVDLRSCMTVLHSPVSKGPNF
ncbi:hypothetical protein C5167_042676 [Papaver somniferum]|uniref:Uncharacterized protein n=1 Tax=Papaver somniferum TaxID=3469 RepID=A0A4Y7L679_PAPSO|nr:hypothetical protein C5167_042676 [Papaver somniferum]